MISQERKKKLKEEYRTMRPPMGVYQLRCIASGKCYLGATQNLDNVFNSFLFQLRLGTYTNKALQKDWNTYGEQAFSLSILEQMEYDEDEMKTDYKEDLKALQELCAEQLAQKEIEYEEIKRI